MARSGTLLIALIAVIGLILSRGFTSEAERHAIVVSAILAIAVQMTAFAVVRITGRQNAALLGWGMGAILRVTTLVLYALIFTKRLGLPPTAALLSFAVFLFASMLLESFLISYAR